MATEKGRKLGSYVRHISCQLNARLKYVEMKNADFTYH